MKWSSIKENGGRIVKGVNTTPDVGPNEIKNQAKKFGNSVDKDGRPPTLSKKVKGSKTNVLFNLGLAEGYKLQLERDKKMLVLNITNTKTGRRTEVRGKPDYESGGYDPDDKLHQLLDALGKSVDMSQLMNGEPVGINPNHPHGDKAKASIDVAYNERFTPMELALMEGGHSIEDYHNSLKEAESKIPQKILDQLKMGIKVEMEHTNNPSVALGIAIDHIKEDPAYYDKLKFIESTQLSEGSLRVDSGGFHKVVQQMVSELDPRTDTKKLADIARMLGKEVYFKKDKVVLQDPDFDFYATEDKDLAKPSEIYVDMDGVLADFFGSWKKLIGKDWREIGDIDSALQKIRDTDDFWLKIPPTENAGNLLSIIKNIKGSYNILSAPLPNDPNSEPHKREWIKKHLKGFPPNKVIITHDKAKYATQPDGTPNILIDDYGVNVQKWQAAGGVGFKHKDHKFERTARNLAAHLKQPVEEHLKEISAKKIGAGALAGMMALSPMQKAFAGDAPTDPLPNKQTSTMVQKDVAGKKDLSKIQAKDVVNNKLVIVMDNGKEFDITDFEGKTAKEKWNNFGKAIKKVYSKHDTKIPNYELKRGDKVIARSTSIGNIYR